MTEQREIIKTALRRYLDAYPQFTELDANLKSQIVRKIERSCFNHTIDQCMVEGVNLLFTDSRFVQIYSSNTSRILANININSAYSDETVRKIVGGALDYDSIATVPSYILDPGASATERAEIELRLKQKIEQKVSRKYTCKRCGGNETIVIEYQARCADEGSSHSIKCVKCENVQRK